MDLQNLYKNQVVPTLQKNRSYKNAHDIPKITKVVVNCCIGSQQDTKAALEDALNDITKITGQKPVRTVSVKSISNFKLRENQEIGCKVTLRGKNMYDFLVRLLAIALPRIRDFRGVPARSFDQRGNYTLGIKDHTIFPEIELDKVKRNLGMDITIVTTAKNKDEAKELLTLLGMPFMGRPQQQQQTAAAAAA